MHGKNPCTRPKTGVCCGRVQACGRPAVVCVGGSPTAVMPVLRVWRLDGVVVFQRSMPAYQAGLKKPLFFQDKSQMLFGDQQRVEDIHRAF